MPRASPEARAAAALRQGGKHPRPPAYLGAEEKAVWREIGECRPVDFFQPGALHLLEQLCIMTVAARRIGVEVQERPADADAAKLYVEYASRCAMHCQKLRLSIQSALRTESGKLDEKDPSSRGQKGKSDVLFGGKVVNF
jgi:hypothetical protein